MSTQDTDLQQLVINVGTTAQIEAGISGGTITADMLSLTTDGPDYATEQWVGQQGYITGITSSDVTAALGYTPLRNTATGTNSLSILGTASPYNNTLNVGMSSSANGVGSTALGAGASANYLVATAIGRSAVAAAHGCVQLGYGTNTSEGTFCVGLTTNNGANHYNYQLLTSTGKIPNERLNMDSTPTSASTNPITSGGVYTSLLSKLGDINYSAGVTLPLNTSYTTTSNGIIRVLANGSQTVNLFVNSGGGDVLVYNYGAGATWDVAIIPVGSGYTVIPQQSGTGSAEVIFYPCK